MKINKRICNDFSIIFNNFGKIPCKKKIVSKVKWIQWWILFNTGNFAGDICKYYFNEVYQKCPLISWFIYRVNTILYNSVYHIWPNWFFLCFLTSPSSILLSYPICRLHGFSPIFCQLHSWGQILRQIHSRNQTLYQVHS